MTGTLGVLGAAHQAGLLDFETALAQLRRTNFYIANDIVDGLRERLARAKRQYMNGEQMLFFEDGPEDWALPRCAGLLPVTY